MVRLISVILNWVSARALTEKLGGQPDRILPVSAEVKLSGDNCVNCRVTIEDVADGSLRFEARYLSCLVGGCGYEEELFDPFAKCFKLYGLE